MNVPFHVYSMRQAIEEGYILDVLANYITYDTKWRLRNLAVEQQESRVRQPGGGRAEGQAGAGPVRGAAPDVASTRGRS